MAESGRSCELAAAAGTSRSRWTLTVPRAAMQDVRAIAARGQQPPVDVAVDFSAKRLFTRQPAVDDRTPPPGTQGTHQPRAQIPAADGCRHRLLPAVEPPRCARGRHRRRVPGRYQPCRSSARSRQLRLPKVNRGPHLRA